MTSNTLQELKKIFFQLDSDNTGYLTASKLKNAMGNLGLHIAIDELLRVIDEVDGLNGQKSGHINFTTFLAATINLKEQISERILRDTFSYFDGQKKGFITQYDLWVSVKCLGANVTEAEVEQMISEYNFEDTSRIEWAEF